MRREETLPEMQRHLDVVSEQEREALSKRLSSTCVMVPSRRSMP
jgi:hypothetical protein